MGVVRDILLVFIGAGSGGVCRWWIGVATRATCGETRFPLATFFSNLLACAIAGAVVGLALRGGAFSSVATKLFLVTGFLGGMSTMSAFGLETVSLLRRGNFVVAGANICLTLVACFLVLWIISRAVEP